MIYEYKCCKCGSTRDAIRSIDDRDKPLTEACECGYSAFKRQVSKSMAIDFNGKYTMAQRAGWGWNDIQNKVKAASGRNNTINVR